MNCATAVALAAMLAAAPVCAEDNALYFSPALSADLSAPSYFDGLYAGVLVGPISARKNNFFTAGADIRGEIGGLVGWNQPIAPGVVAGGELQLTLATDVTVSSYVRALALARLGFYVGDNALAYMFAGAGYFASSAAFEAGLGFEARVTDTMAVRLETAGIGQIGPVPNGNNIPAISALRITTGATWRLDGTMIPRGPNAAPATDFTGAYAGANVGGLTDMNFNFFDDYGHGWHLSRFDIGAFGGVNYALNDSVRMGLEAQIDTSFDTSGDAGLDVLALGRLGLVVRPGLMPYLAAGVGLVEGRAAYAVGGGAEYALWGDASLRGEALLLGRLDGTPGLGSGTGPSTSKVTIGTVWHLH